MTTAPQARQSASKVRLLRRPASLAVSSATLQARLDSLFGALGGILASSMVFGGMTSSSAFRDEVSEEGATAMDQSALLQRLARISEENPVSSSLPAVRWLPICMADAREEDKQNGELPKLSNQISFWRR
jgi:hypothetical protein